MTPTPIAEVDARSANVATGEPKDAWEARSVSGAGTPGRRMSMAAVWRIELADFKVERSRRRRVIVIVAATGEDFYR